MSKMSTKTISITEEAYECLRSLKDSQSDSFSQIIIKYFPKKVHYQIFPQKTFIIRDFC